MLPATSLFPRQALLARLFALLCYLPFIAAIFCFVTFVFAIQCSSSSASQAPPLSLPTSEDALSSSYLHLTLSSVRRWQDVLREKEIEGIDRTVIVESLVEALTWLFEVAKLPQAVTELKKVLEKEAPVLTRFGFYPNFDFNADISRLVLKDPAYSGYTIYLLHIKNNTPFDVNLQPGVSSTIHLTNGTILGLKELKEDHPLYPKLKRMVKSFTAPRILRAGSTLSVNLIADSPILEKDILFVRVDFAGRSIVIKFYENI